MTYGDIYEEFLTGTKIDESLIEDYRPAILPFIHDLVPADVIPNAIVVWFKNGSKIIYFARKEKNNGSC